MMSLADLVTRSRSAPPQPPATVNLAIVMTEEKPAERQPLEDLQAASDTGPRAVSRAAFVVRARDVVPPAEEKVSHRSPGPLVPEEVTR
jgi:hypothetical protein